MTNQIDPRELPKLIAAAVEKALAQHPATEAQVAALSKGSIRIGIVPVEFGGRLPPSIGFILRELKQLENPETIEATNE